MSDTTDHEHTLVWVTSAGEEQARQYCGGCGYRSEWQELPPELAGIDALLSRPGFYSVDEARLLEEGTD